MASSGPLEPKVLLLEVLATPLEEMDTCNIKNMVYGQTDDLLEWKS